MILALANPIESAFANPCELETCKLKDCEKHETRNCKSLRNIAKHCETIPANLRESLQNQICESLRNLSLSICDSIFAKACENLNTYILHLQILAKTQVAKSCERCIYCIPTPAPAPLQN